MSGFRGRSRGLPPTQRGLLTDAGLVMSPLGLNTELLGDLIPVACHAVVGQEFDGHSKEQFGHQLSGSVSDSGDAVPEPHCQGAGLVQACERYSHGLLGPRWLE